MNCCCCPPPRGMREMAALPSEKPHGGAGYRMATMTSPSSSLSLFFENELGGGWEEMQICRALSVGDRKDVVCRAEVEFENA